MTNTTLERAANAAADAAGKTGTYVEADGDLDCLTVDGIVDFYAVVRAVLMAVRDGSPEVFAAMDRAQPLWPSSHCDNRRELERSANEPRVRAMIDAILAEGE